MSVLRVAAHREGCEMHTEGPWEVLQPCSGATDSDDERLWICAGEKLVARVGFLGREREANAHLIAAAPEMLAALERVVALGSAHPESERGKLVSAARAATAKARGDR